MYRIVISKIRMAFKICVNVSIQRPHNPIDIRKIFLNCLQACKNLLAAPYPGTEEF
jgi:hypothetical protein